MLFLSTRTSDHSMMAEPKVDLPAEDRNKQREVVLREEDQSSLGSEEMQNGAKEMEAISRTWSRWSLISAYAG